jgi:arylsulfate sulfotransferase
MRNQSWILKIDYENGTGTGEILWRLGEGGDFQIVGCGPSQWFYGQHAPNLVLDNGSQLTLAIWDNGNFRIDSSGHAYGGTIACYSRATIFQVDQTARVANVLWQDRPGPYDFWGGSIAVFAKWKRGIRSDQLIRIRSCVQDCVGARLKRCAREVNSF